MKTSSVARNTAAPRAGWKDYISRLQGSTVRFGFSGYEPSLVGIAQLESACRALSDEEILRSSLGLRDRARSGEPLAALRTSFFALTREASRRALGQRPYDEQVAAALALDDGHVVEMQTGEGKTLAAVMPAALNALGDRGGHVLTFNDYLARRDAEWMGPVYRMLGLSEGCIQQGMPPGARRAAYNADITYVTAKEAGFDHLRDLLAMDAADLVHRPFHFALVDEADSLMIDEARVPLVIAGSVERETSIAPRLAELVASLTPGVHFDTDEYGRDIELTEAGIDHAERTLGCGDLHRAEHIGLLTGLNCALHARALLRRDVDYIVRDGRIEIVDEFTGRVLADRHWPDGLQAALEAKEGLEPRTDGRILGSMTLQRFLRGYTRLSGMTGTARDAAGELQQLYRLDVVVIPTHRPVVRVDQEDVVFSHRDAKDRAIVGEIQRAHAAGRPVLVGTSTVTESERLTDRLRSAGVPCEVLNAKNDAGEAAIVARAGAPGAVTISTNMAGRGTDIRLGGEERSRASGAPAGGEERSGASGAPAGGEERSGASGAPASDELGGVQGSPPFKNDELGGVQGSPPFKNDELGGVQGSPPFKPAGRDRVAALGGLYVIGTNRHESRRVDLQLRGRAGRQGDPGESRFFVSLEDDLLVRYGISGLIPARLLGEKSDVPVENPVVRREVARAQRITEGQNAEIRRTLAQYAAVVEEQHRQLTERRRAMLSGADPPDIWGRVPEQRTALVAAAGEQAVLDAERTVTLACIDRAWRDHLARCADLREGIHLVRLGGQDPLTVFTSEAIRAFSGIDEAIDQAVLAALHDVRIVGGRVDLTDTAIKPPTATWTYLVNDDPFRNRIGTLLTGPGGTTVAIYSAVIMMPLLILWGLIEKLLRRGAPRRSDPFGK